MSINLDAIASSISEKLTSALKDHEKESVKSSGTVFATYDGIALIGGLQDVLLDEVVQFESGSKGIILNLDPNCAQAILLGSDAKASSRDRVERTYKTLSVKSGPEVLGRVLNAVGEPIDNCGPLNCKYETAIERPAPGIMDRQSIFIPMETGYKAIDSMIPIGRGQRELIVGDRGTGKTTIAIDAILHQGTINESLTNKNQKMHCVYVSIGHKLSSVAKTISTLKNKGAMSYTTVVVAGAADGAAMQYLAPYTGCAIAEYFRDNGMHALVIYDDLSKHAVAYRQISLLLRRPPGREAYPGDVFYLHSRLLERAAQLSEKAGGGSLTALPIAETQNGDISAYIPTNIVSITDGQIFLDAEMFNAGILPPVNIGLSVSRVGSAAQSKIMRKVSGRLKLDMSQFRELESFAKFGANLDKTSMSQLKKGQVLNELFKQNREFGLTAAVQAAILHAGNNGWFNSLEINQIKHVEKELLFNLTEGESTYVLQQIFDEEGITKKIDEDLKQAVSKAISSLSA